MVIVVVCQSPADCALSADSPVAAAVCYDEGPGHCLLVREEDSRPNATMVKRSILSSVCLLAATHSCSVHSFSVSPSGWTSCAHRRTTGAVATPSVPSAPASCTVMTRIGTQTRAGSSRSYETSLRPSVSLRAVEGDFDPDAIAKSREAVESGSLSARLRALYKFTRPHTIRGTILASIAGTVRALVDTPGAIASANWGAMLPRAAIGMVALLLGNAYIVGINQIFDRDIDVMNKPFLPVASGEMSQRVAWATVLFSGIVGPAIV